MRCLCRKTAPLFELKSGGKAPLFELKSGGKAPLFELKSGGKAPLFELKVEARRSPRYGLTAIRICPVTVYTPPSSLDWYRQRTLWRSVASLRWRRKVLSGSPSCISMLAERTRFDLTSHVSLPFCILTVTSPWWGLAATTVPRW